MAVAPTRPVTWVWEPFCAATAVRDPLVLTGNPWKSPAARFAAPTPTISRSPSTSSPLRAENAEAVEIVSVNDTSAMPSAPATSSHRSSRGTVGTVNGGTPSGIGPTTATPRSCRSSRVTVAIASTTATSTPGNRGSARWKPRISTRLAAPTARAAPTVSPSTRPCTNPAPSSTRLSASTEKPRSLGSWPTTMVSASPFMYPTCVGFDNSSATNPSRKTPASTVIAPTSNASSEAYATARPGSPSATVSGITVAAIIGPSAESGPSTRTLDGPKTA